MKLKKLVSVLSAVALLLCAVPMLVLADTPALTPGTPLTVIPGDGEVDVTFTPAQTGLYEWHVVSVEPTEPVSPWIGITVDSQAEPIYLEDYGYSHEASDGFCWVYYLTGGEQYTLTIEDTNASAAGAAVTVSAVTVSVLTQAAPVTVVPGQFLSYVSFTPAETGDYVFSSAAVTSTDPWLRGIWGEDWESPDRIAGNADDYDGLEFYAVYTLTAGETYTLALYDFGRTEDGFAVTVAPYYGITEHPTAADPTVEVNRPDEVSSYQWYTAKRSSVAITEERIGRNWGSDYDAVSGTWSVGGNDNNDGTYAYNPFTLPLKAGDVLTVTSSDALDPVESPLLSFEYVQPEEKNGALVYTITYDYEYEVCLTTDGADSTFTFKVTTDVVDTKVDGQTAATMTKYDKNATYACVVTFKNGIALTSNFVKMEPAIIKQPTVGDPSVTVSFAEDVKTYEWYTVKIDGQPITDDDVEGAVGDAIYEDGAWSNTDPMSFSGMWAYDLFSVSLQAGDTLTVTCTDAMNGSFSYFMGQNTGSVVDAVESGNMLVYTVSDDDIYELGIATYGANSTFTVFAGRAILDQKLTDQTTDTLTAYEKCTTYACVVTYTDGVMLTTAFVEMVPAFVQQPTAAAPAVKVNFEKDVHGYQWYVQKETAVTTDTATVFEYDDGSSDYDAATGMWTATPDSYGDYGYFVIEAEAGDIVRLQLSEELSEDEYLGLENVDNEVYFNGPDSANDDGFYEIAILEDGTYYLYISIDTKVKAWVIRYEAIAGQTTDTLSEREVGKTYRCKVTYAEGDILTSDAFTWTAEAELAMKQAEADKVAALINALPETVTKADAEAVAAAKEAYDALADDVKALIAEAVKAKLNAAVAAIEALNQTVEVPEKPTDESADIPPTGENSYAWLWAVLVLMSGCAVAFTKQKAHN